MFYVTCLFVFVLVLAIAVGQDNSSVCYNRFEYEYHVLQKLVQLENENNQLKMTVDLLQNRFSAVSQWNTTVLSTYIRWGRSQCPESGANLVYEGFAAGSHYTHSGGGVEYLCLPREPEWNQFSDTAENLRGLLYGVEYETSDTALSSLHNHNVPCAVCKVPKSATIMIPGRKTCFSDWTAEYDGYLMSGYHSHASSTSYACLDNTPEVLDNGEADQNGALFYMVEGRCGSLACPPYTGGRELSCVVCSK